MSIQSEDLAFFNAVPTSIKPDGTKRYALIENSKVTNLYMEDGTNQLEAGQSKVECEDRYVGIGFDYDSGTDTFTDPNAVTVTNDMIMNQLRVERNGLLAQTDWTQNADVPDATKTKWQAYRQELRDLPANQTPTELTLSNLTWPTKP